MSKRPWYKRYGGDFIMGTMMLTLEEKGAYSLCLDLIYDRGGPIPDDDRWIAGICGVSTRRWRAIRGRLVELGKLVTEGGTLTNGRSERELGETEEATQERAENGSKGGRKRAENLSKTSRKHPEKSPGQSEINDIALAIPEARDQKPEEDSVANATGAPAPRPVYTDSKHELWGEGVPILRSLGVKEREARSNIGRWLKAAGDDAQSVLGAIQRARDMQIFDPVPWVTRALGSPKAQNAKSNSVLEALDRLGKRVAAEPGRVDYQPVQDDFLRLPEG